MSFKGKTALVTGGTSGIGRATVMAFVQAGASVAFVGRDPERGAAVLREIRNCAVNNAGAIDVGMFKRLADISEKEFDAHLAVNLKSVWLCMAHEIAHLLKRRRGGAIVNTSSVNGLGGAPMSALYAAAKAGILDLVHPSGRIGTPHETHRRFAGLCSDEASYVTGHSMIVDGGMTAPYR